MRSKVVSLLLGAGVVAMHGVALASEAGEHGGGEHALNWTDFAARTICFVLLVGILVKLLKGPIVGFFATRREEIAKLLAELENKRKEAELKSAEYKEKMSSLESETKKIVEELIAEGESERQKIIAAAHKQAEYITQQAQLTIQQEVKAARERLQDEIGELSVAAAEELLRKRMKADDQDRLVRDFMTRVVEAK